MASSADIIVYSRNKRLVLAVETEASSEPTAQEATELRCRLLEHPLFPRGSFFLFVNYAAMFLWREETPPAAPPDFSASADTVLKDYELLDDGKGVPSKGALEIVVFAWLSSIANGLREADPASPPGQMLIQSGLYDEIRGGEVQFEPCL